MSLSLETRFVALEGQLNNQRRLIRVLSCALFGLVSVTVFSAAAVFVDGNFDNVVARRLVIKDAAGRDRIRLEAPGLGPNGDVKIAILDQAGTEIAVIGQYDDSLSVVSLRRYAGDTPGVHLVASGTSAGLSAESGGGNVPIYVTSTKSGNSIGLKNPVDAKAGIEMSVVNNKPSLNIVTKNSATNISLSLDNQDAPSVHVQNSAIPNASAIGGPVRTLGHDGNSITVRP